MKDTDEADSSTVKPFPYQVAGHLAQDGFKLTLDGCVLKPVQRPPKGKREVLFYETVFNGKEERDEIMELRRLLPRYYGVVELDTTKYLKLENITGTFTVPCVMDIKIGMVTWDDEADEKFRERRKTKWPLKEITGFSILGFMVYNHGKSCYDCYGREWCLKLATVEDAEKAFQEFLGCTEVELSRHIILEQLIAQLMEIKRWFTTQRIYRFIASSILIVYESDSKQINSSLQKALEHKDTRTELSDLPWEDTLVKTKMIDTARVFTSTDVDNNYLFGLENVISIVQKCRRINTKNNCKYNAIK